MKILVVQDHLRSGGTERQSILLTRAFREAGHHARLLTFRPGGALAATVGDIPHVCLQPFDTRLDWFAPELTRALRRFAPEIILCMGRIANCYAGYMQRRLPRSRVIATLRTGRPLPWLFRRSLRRVPHVVANSAEAKANVVREHGVPEPRITVVHNSLVFPDAPDAGARERIRAEHGATPQTTVLLSVAMFRRQKGQGELIDLAAGLPADLDWQLWLAGDGPQLPACRRRVEAAGLAARVRFLGWQRDPGGLYAAADVAVHASSSEALSNFLIEAQAHGLPAVAFAAQGIAECFIPGITGTVVPRGDRDAFVAAVTRLARATPEERATRADRARHFARERFDPIRQARSFLDVFERVLHSPL